MCISHLHTLPILFNLRFLKNELLCSVSLIPRLPPRMCTRENKRRKLVHVGNEAIVFCILGGGRHEMLDSKQMPNRQHHDAELQKNLSNTVM